jgi:hypothetical protein
MGSQPKRTLGLLEDTPRAKATVAPPLVVPFGELHIYHKGREFLAAAEQYNVYDVYKRVEGFLFSPACYNNILILNSSVAVSLFVYYFFSLLSSG